VYAASSDCVVILALGDLVTWRHFVRASRGPLSFLLSSWPVKTQFIQDLRKFELTYKFGVKGTNWG
jgi:hypothetical protein